MIMKQLITYQTLVFDCDGVVLNSAVSRPKCNLDLMELDSRHYKRYGTRDYMFIVAAASRVKGDSSL